MSESVLIDQAICLPAQEVEALIQGRTIATIPRMFIDPGDNLPYIRLMPQLSHYHLSVITMQIYSNLLSITWQMLILKKF